MGSISLIQLLNSLISLYCLLIVAWAILSFFRNAKGIVRDIYKALNTIVEPYVKLFRKLIPPVGGMDFSPLIALLVLQIGSRILFSFLL